MPHKKNPDVFELTRAQMQQAARIAPADHTDQQQPSIRLFPRPADHKGSIPSLFRRVEGLPSHGYAHDAGSKGERADLRR